MDITVYSKSKILDIPRITVSNYFHLFVFNKGVPAETYQYGIQSWTGVFGIMLAPLFGAYVTGPLFLKLKVASVFEYFKIRFDSNLVRLASACCYLVRNFLAISIYMCAPAISLTSMTGLNTKISLMLVGVMTTFYTTVGGIKGVIWTDVFQMCIIFFGVILVICKGVFDVGGLQNVWSINKNGNRLNFFIFDLNPFIRQSNWSNFFGSLAFFSITYGIDQQMIQRFSAAKSVKKAQQAFLFNIPGIFIYVSLCSFTGLVIYANFANCDPLSIPERSKVTNSNQLISFFLKEKLGVIPGAAGLFLSSIFSASLSTLSSVLSSQAAIFWIDIFQQFHYFKYFNDNQSLRTTKLIVCACGLVSTLFSFVILSLGSNMFQLSLGLLGAFGTPILGLFLMGYLFKLINSIGAFIGTLCGFFLVLWISVGSYIVKPIYPKLRINITGCNISPSFHANYTTARSQEPQSYEVENLSGFNKIYGISFSWIPILGLLVTVLIGVIISAITNRFKNKNELK